MTIFHSILLAFVATVTQSVFASHVLPAGVLSLDCGSALRIGVVTCDNHTDPNQAASVSETQVSEFLANYGKPPREAVRALLDPSDNNIAAWLRKQREVVAVASYVASRMTELGAQFEGNPDAAPSIFASNLPAMMQMRATLFFKIQDPSSFRWVRALQKVVGQYPSIEGRLVQIGEPPAAQRSTWLAALNTVLPISIASHEASDNISVPSLLIEDLRYKISSQMDAAGLTAEGICEQIVRLRLTAERRHRDSKPSTP